MNTGQAILITFSQQFTPNGKFSSSSRTGTVINSDDIYFYTGAGKTTFIPRLGRKHENNYS